MTQNKTAEDAEAFADLVTELNSMAQRCAEETVYRAELCGENRNIVLHSVIRRLKYAIGKSP